MGQRYETTRSRGATPLKLTFREGTWDSLPFEVRLSRPWYGGELCACTGITTHERGEIARWGYCIAAVEPAESGQLNIGNFKARSPTSLILIPILEAVATVVPDCSDSRVDVSES